MRNKILLGLSALVCMASLTSCGKEDDKGQAKKSSGDAASGQKKNGTEGTGTTTGCGG